MGEWLTIKSAMSRLDPILFGLKNKFNKINLLNIKNTPSNALSEQY